MVSQSSQGNGHAIAFGYVDVEHGLQKITGGNRLVLQYKLLKAEPVQPRASDPGYNARFLPKVLKWWKINLRDNPFEWNCCLVWVLEQRKVNNLCVSNLSRKDQIIVHTIEEACKKTDFTCLLAHMTVEAKVTIDPNAGYNEWDITEGKYLISMSFNTLLT